MISLLVFSGVGLLGVGIAVVAKKQHQALLAAIANDPDIMTVGDETWWRSTTFATRAVPHVQMQATGGGKNNPPRWHATASAPTFSMRSTLSLSREGLSGKLREMVGAPDVHIGDPAFDAHVCLRGDTPDALRGVFSAPQVQHATRQLLANAQFWTLDIDKDGGVNARFGRRRQTLDEIKRILLDVAAFIDAIEQHSDRQALADPQSLMRTKASGSGSGAPISIPVGDRH